MDGWKCILERIRLIDSERDELYLTSSGRRKKMPVWVTPREITKKFMSVITITITIAPARSSSGIGGLTHGRLVPVQYTCPGGTCLHSIPTFLSMGRTTTPTTPRSARVVVRSRETFRSGSTIQHMLGDFPDVQRGVLVPALERNVGSAMDACAAFAASVVL